MNTGSGSLLDALPLVLLIGLVFYFVLIRPQGKERQKRETMISALKKGDRVMTSAGIYGTIAAVEEQAFMLKVAENTKIRIAKDAIAHLVTDGTAAE